MNDIVLADAICAQLQKGKEHAITGKILAQRLGLKNTRSIRIAMAEMRHAGIPIIGGQKGYFIAADINELNEARQYLLSYIKDLCLDLKYLKRISARYAGQLSMRL
jgi:hypothetical protein